MVKIKKNRALREILRFYKKHIKYYAAFIIILIIKAAISFLNTMLVAKMITSMMEYNFSQAIDYAFINLILLFIYNILSYINTYCYKNLENKVRFDLQKQIITSALNIKMSYYDNLGTGKVITRLTSDIDKISESFKSLTEKIVNTIRRITYLIYLFFLNIYIGLYVLCGVIIVSGLYTVRIYYLEKLKPGVKEQKEIVNSKIIETIRAVKDIKTLNCDENILDLVGKSQKSFIKKDNHEYYVGNALCKLTDMIVSIFDFFFIIVCICLMKDHGLTTTIFYLCDKYKDHTFNMATEIGDFRYKLAECRVCAERLLHLLYPSKEDIDEYGNKYLKEYEGDITFSNVTFSYSDDEKKVLDDVSFKIESKKTTAFVGESGSGKSTIVSLIGHLYYKTSGEILLGNKRIEDMSKDFIRDNITVVNQFPYLFNLSIRDNFKIVKSDITDEEIWTLCKKVLMIDYIKSLSDGLDSVIGEAGCQLSGGQKQRLSIARALCRNTKVLIFDEATSSLDNNSQKEVMKVIKELEKDLTIILIAHRLTTVTYASSIILLKDGKIIDSGTHDYLYGHNNYYKNLYLKSSQD